MAITTDEGSYQDYGYTGWMQSITIPHKGIYKFEVWGAGGTGYGSGGSLADNTAGAGRGGYSVGYRLCNAGEVYYICVGGSNTYWNGGGRRTDAGGGGDATHIATANALLRDLSGNVASIRIVAGGGGGAGQANGTPGHGGGLEGGSNGPGGGTQTAGGSGYNGGGVGSFGQGGNASGSWASGGGSGGAGGGGGGGFYGGGGGGGYTGGGSGGAGGSGYIGGLPAFTAPDGTYYAPSTTQGAGSGPNTHGMARITYVKPDTLPVIYNGTRLARLVFNGTTVKSLVYNGTRLFFRSLFARRGCARPCSM